MNENSFPAAFVLMFFVLVPAPDGVAQTAAKQGAEPEQPAGQHQQHRRGPKQIALTDSKGAVARLWKPDLTTLPLTAIDRPGASTDGHLK